MSASEQQGGTVIRNTVEPGAFEEHLKGMQRGAAAPPDAHQDAPPPEKKERE
jgi:hypothetical protein